MVSQISEPSSSDASPYPLDPFEDALLGSHGLKRVGPAHTAGSTLTKRRNGGRSNVFFLFQVVVLFTSLGKILLHHHFAELFVEAFRDQANSNIPDFRCFWLG